MRNGNMVPICEPYVITTSGITPATNPTFPYVDSTSPPIPLGINSANGNLEDGFQTSAIYDYMKLSFQIKNNNNNTGGVLSSGNNQVTVYYTNIRSSGTVYFKPVYLRGYYDSNNDLQTIDFGWIDNPQRADKMFPLATGETTTFTFDEYYTEDIDYTVGYWVIDSDYNFLSNLPVAIRSIPYKGAAVTTVF